MEAYAAKTQNFAFEAPPQMPPRELISIVKKNIFRSTVN
jgi:hypothetical protein